jgi:hypothetical protein
MNQYSTISDGLQRSLFRVIQNGYTGYWPLVTVKIDGSPLTNPNYTHNIKVVSSDVNEVALDMKSSSVLGFNELNNNDSGTSLEAIPLRGGNQYFAEDIAPYGGSYTTYDHLLSQNNGISITAAYANSMSTINYVNTGALVLNKSSIAGTSKAAIYQATCPTNGGGATAAATTASVTGTMAASSKVLTVSALGPEWMAPQHGITVAGAGASGATLYANILHIDDTGLILTLDKAASTAVSGAVLTNTQCALNPIVQSASQVNGAAVPASATLVGTNGSGQIISQTGTITNNTTGTAAGLSAASALPSGTTTPTPAAGDSSTALATTAYVQNAISTTPAWLEYLADGADGAYEATAASCTSSSPCVLYGIKHYTSFKVDSGAYLYSINSGAGGLTIHATGACSINGTILVNGAKNVSTSGYVGGGPGGGGGGGTAAGTSGGGYLVYAFSPNAYGGGSAGAASGGTGGTGAYSWGSAINIQRMLLNEIGTKDGLWAGGAAGGAGGSSGGAGGKGGMGFTAICASIDGTGGTIDASGAAGTSASANNTGAGGGGGGGVVLLSSRATVTTWPTVSVSGGSGGTCGSYTTCGVGGAGVAGWYLEFQGW